MRKILIAALALSTAYAAEQKPKIDLQLKTDLDISSCVDSQEKGQLHSTLEFSSSNILCTDGACAITPTEACLEKCYLTHASTYKDLVEFGNTKLAPISCGGSPIEVSGSKAVVLFPDGCPFTGLVCVSKNPEKVDARYIQSKLGSKFKISESKVNLDSSSVSDRRNKLGTFVGKHSKVSPTHNKSKAAK